MKSNINEKDVEFTDCPMCGNKEYTEKYKFYPVKLVKCNKCGLEYLNPRISEKNMIEHYSSDEFYENYSAGTGYEIQERSLEETFERFLKQLNKRNLTGGKLLEVGCGFGYLLKLSRKFFSYSVGTDFSQTAVEKAADYCDEAYCGGMEAIPEDTGNFDCIIAFSVIEHIYDPNKFIEEIKGRLNKGGILIIATPDVGSYWNKILRNKWPFYIPTEHVCLYDNVTLKKLLSINGFKNTKTFTVEHGWPLVAFISKLGFNKLALKLSKKAIGKKSLFVPNVIVCGVGVNE